MLLQGFRLTLRVYRPGRRSFQNQVQELSSGQKAAKLLTLLPQKFEEFSTQVQVDDSFKVRKTVGNEEKVTPELDFEKIYVQVYKRAVLSETR